MSRLIPDAQDISTWIESLLDSAISSHAPFLRAMQWQVERKHLASSIAKAALAWREVLVNLDADILGTEAGLPERSTACQFMARQIFLVGLPDGCVLVVDYKRSSANSRRTRMQRVYDSQANLYRTRLQTGGLRRKGSAPLQERLRAGDTTAIVYFMSNDLSSLVG